MCRRKVLEDGADRTVIGKLFQTRGAVELKARLTNTVLSAWLGQQLAV